MLIFGICYDLLKTPCIALQKERCICNTMRAQFLGKKTNLTQLMVESAMGEKRRPGNTVPNCLSFSNISQQIVRIVSLCSTCSWVPFHRSSGNRFKTIKTILFIYIYNHFRDTKPMRFQFHFRKLLRKKCMQNIQQMWARCVILAHTHTPTVWCWGICISSYFHGSLKSCCHFQKTPACHFFDRTVKRRFYTAKRRRANVYATWPHCTSTFSFCAYKSRWSLHGFTHQGFATARPSLPFLQLNMKQPGFTMAQIHIIITYKFHGNFHYE